MDSVYDQLLGDNLDISKTELKEYIKHHQEKVCFILDGFDELNVEYQKNSDVLDLIKGKIFYGSTVLVTSRPLKLREVLKDSDAFYKIVGFRQDQKDEIFQKYFINDSNSANELSATVSKNHYLKEITENPLNALLICVLWEDNNQRLPKTKTELYGEVVKSITKRYCAKFDIKCDGRSFPASMDVLLLSQGRLAWKGSKINKFHFDIDDMEGEKTTDVLPLGMMVQGETDSRTSGYAYVSFLHPTLQEFMAAYYIHHMLTLHKEGALTAELLNTIVKREELEGILIFLCGLSGDQAKPLLDDFHDATNEKALTMKEEYVLKSLVRRCLTCLGATNVAAKLADTVAPAMPEEVVFDFDYLSVEWTEGFIAIVQFLQKSSDDTLQKTFRTLVLASIHWAVDIPRDMLVRFRSVLESTTVVESVIMTGWSMPLLPTANNTVLRSSLSEFFPDDRLKKVKITVHAAADAVGPLKCMTLSDMFDDLRKKRNVNEISISVFTASETSYCGAISRLLQSQTSLKSFALDVSLLHTTQGCQDFRVVLDAIKNHQSLYSVSMKQPADAIVSDRTHNASAVLISIAQIIRENRILTSFHLHIWNCNSPCSRFALTELAEAIRSNRDILKEVTIYGFPVENESDQDVVYDIMRNKPSTMRTLELSMDTRSPFSYL
ncbi:PREDICTED: uncharacterized protein LOC109475639 [Branchiostoma belcheri]|uniref:Uncharacterized protein LOC109475639 n=1 Tax=Branchiostoma belcheri TaxID=7741 RepID=A0A6P4ZDF6_BRABE|nr:PREDICTED: uncharacterized protein LOC109475639 [Branchiostoma belcheri]